jgi:hypothetical protein
VANLIMATPPSPASSLPGLLPNPAPDLGTTSGVITDIADSAAIALGDVVAAHSTLAAALTAAKAAVAAAREREQQAALVWRLEKAVTDALECDLVAAERQLAAPSETPFLPDTVDTFEVFTITILHAQVVNVQDIRSLVPVTLDPFSNHYAPLARPRPADALDDHVTSDVAASTLPHWWGMDNVVLSWLFDTLTIKFQDIVRQRGGTTRQVWLAIEEELINRKDGALHLNAALWTFIQGDLNVNDYCHKMKGMADTFRDLDEPMAEHTLVLNILRGLNKRYDLLNTFLKRVVPFPSFHDVHNDLLLEELTMGVEAASDSATTFTASSGQQYRPLPFPTPFGAPCPLPPPGDGGGHDNGGGDGGCRCHNNRRRSISTPTINQDRGNTPWPSFYNPWTDTISMWLSPSMGGPLFRSLLQQHTPCCTSLWPFSAAGGASIHVVFDSLASTTSSIAAAIALDLCL